MAHQPTNQTNKHRNLVLPQKNITDEGVLSCVKFCHLGKFGKSTPPLSRQSPNPARFSAGFHVNPRAENKTPGLFYGCLIFIIPSTDRREKRGLRIRWMHHEIRQCKLHHMSSFGCVLVLSVQTGKQANKHAHHRVCLQGG